MSYSLEEIAQSFDNPVQAPPLGITPNYVTPQTNAHATYIAAGICGPLILIAAILVVLDKLTAKRRPTGWGDGLLLVSAAGSISYIIMIVIYVSSGPYAKHSWDVKVEDLSKRTIILVWMTAWLYSVWMLTIKLSLLLMYLAIFHTLRWLRLFVYGGIVVLCICHTIACLVTIITCGPRGGSSQVSWIAGMSSSQCVQGFKFGMFQTVMGLVGDIYLIVLPIPAVWSLQLKASKKIGIMTMFATGLIAIVASSWMIYYRARVLNGDDILWKVVYQGVASICEMMAGILVAAMPSIAAITRRFSPTSSFQSQPTKEQVHSVETIVTHNNHCHPWVKEKKESIDLNVSVKRNNSASTKRNSGIEVRHKKSNASFWTSNDQLSQVRIWAGGSEGSQSARSSDDPAGIRRTTEFSVETIDQESFDEDIPRGRSP